MSQTMIWQWHLEIPFFVCDCNLSFDAVWHEEIFNVVQNYSLEYTVSKKAQGHLARKSFARIIFKLDSWSPGRVSFLLEPSTKFKEEKRLGL